MSTELVRLRVRRDCLRCFSYTCSLPSAGCQYSIIDHRSSIFQLFSVLRYVVYPILETKSVVLVFSLNSKEHLLRTSCPMSSVADASRLNWICVTEFAWLFAWLPLFVALITSVSDSGAETSALPPGEAFSVYAKRDRQTDRQTDTKPMFCHFAV